MIEPAYLNSILGFFMPLLTNLFINKDLPREFKTLIAIVTSLFIGILSAKLQGLLLLSSDNLFQTFITIFSISQIAYNLFWKNLFLKGGEINGSNQ